MRFSFFRTAWLIGAACALVVGCQGETSTAPPIVPIRNMHDQPRYDPQEVSEFFSDGRTMRPLVAGVVAREMEVDTALATGRHPLGSGDVRTDSGEGGWVTTVPEEIRQRFGDGNAMLVRGQRQFNIYCAPCHGATGDGQGMIARRSAEAGSVFWPPTFHDASKRGMPDGQIFATITNGVRTMPAYRHNISVADRWAIVSYVRALQLASPEAGTAGPSVQGGQQGEEQEVP